MPLLLALLLGCAAGPQFPGPLGPVGRGASRSPAPAASAARDIPEAPERSPRRSRAPDPELGAAIAVAAQRYLTGDLDGWRDDCSGYVCAVYGSVGVQLNGSTRSLWELAERTGTAHRRRYPEPGDLAFFDNTYDRDHDGRADDELTHIAIVLSVDANGTITLAHGGTSRGRTLLTMNLRHPDVHADETGAVLNDYLRRRRATDPPGLDYLAGGLWRGFATPSPDAWAAGS